jgi:hypothetical protein
MLTTKAFYAQCNLWGKRIQGKSEGVWVKRVVGVGGSKESSKGRELLYSLISHPQSLWVAFDFCNHLTFLESGTTKYKVNYGCWSEKRTAHRTVVWTAWSWHSLICSKSLFCTPPPPLLPGCPLKGSLQLKLSLWWGLLSISQALFK